MHITFSSVYTDVLESSLYHVHDEQLIMEAATKTCSLEIAVHEFLKFKVKLLLILGKLKVSLVEFVFS